MNNCKKLSVNALVLSALLSFCVAAPVSGQIAQNTLGFTANPINSFSLQSPNGFSQPGTLLVSPGNQQTGPIAQVAQAGVLFNPQPGVYGNQVVTPPGYSPVPGNPVVANQAPVIVPGGTYQPAVPAIPPGLNFNPGLQQPIAPRAGAGNLAGEHIGLDEGLTWLQGFAPVYQVPGQRLGFIESRAIKFHESSEAFGFNLQGGLRNVAPNRQNITGFNVGYDYRNTGLFDFHQISVGYENLGFEWDFRANGYGLLSGDTKSVSVGDFVYTGNNLAATQTFLDAYSGFDIELGYNFTARDPAIDFRVFGGGYGFFSDDAPDVGGGFVRMEGIWNDQITVDTTFLFDNQFGNTISLTASLLYGGGRRVQQVNGFNVPEISDRLDDPLHKNMHIVIRDREEAVTILNPADGEALDIVHFDSNAAAGGTGTFESPFNSLANPAANRDIALLHAGSNFNGENITIDDAGQRLLGDGAGVAHTTDSQFGMISLPRANGLVAQPVIDQAPQPAVSIAANNVEVSGLNITRALNDGIRGSDVAGFDINRNTIELSVDDGIDLNGNISGTIASNTVTGSIGAASHGMEIGTWDAGTISGNTTSNNGQDGISISTLNGGIISGNASNGNADDGFSVGTFAAGTFDSNTAGANGDAGFQFVTASGGTISNNIAANNDRGFRFLTASGSNITGNLASGNTNDGFQFDSVTSGLVNQNTSSNNGGRGFAFDTLSGGIIRDNAATSSGLSQFSFNTVSNGSVIRNTATDGAGVGMFFDTVSGGLIRENEASQNGGNGIQVATFSGGTIRANAATSNANNGFGFSSVTGGTLISNTATSNVFSGFAISSIAGGNISSNVSSQNNEQGFFNVFFTGGSFNNNSAVNNGDMGYLFALPPVVPASASNNTGSGNAGGGNTFDF